MKTHKPNPLKVAAKAIIRTAATALDIKPTDLLMAYKFVPKGMSKKDLNCRLQFASVLHLLETKEIEVSWLSGLSARDVDMPVYEEFAIPKYANYSFLFDVITNMYFRKDVDFPRFRFDNVSYPSVGDLFDGISKRVDAEEVKPGPTVKDESIVLVPAVKKIFVPDMPVLLNLDPPEPKIIVPYSTPSKVLKWNKQQRAAFKMIHAWMRTANRKQVFRLYGYAGTGKTEMSKAVADFVMNEAGKNNVPEGAVVLFSAYTGKACSVLRTKGCRSADTLHSFLYKPVFNEETGVPSGFVINRESPLSQASLLIVDEASMVNDEMADDIMSFGIPVLVLGDPAQLPPVKGEGALTNVDPDYMMTDVERQAKDNPIIYLATLARQGLSIEPGRYGESVVYEFGTPILDEHLMDADQVIVGLNNTRKTLNRRMRRLNGKFAKDPLYPVAGDKLMCLKNNRNNGLYNGTLWTSSTPIIRKIMRPIKKGSTILAPGDVDVLAFKVRSIDEFDPSTGKPYKVETQCSLHMFNEALPEPEWREIAGADQFTFGYAATGHKMQGSQADHVFLKDESDAFRDMKFRHQYTTITRAAERLTMIL